MACDNKQEAEAAKKSYKTTLQKLTSDVMTPEVLWSFGRIGNVSLSPDQSKLVYTITYFNKEEDRSYSDIYVMDLSNNQSTQLTHTYINESEVKWTPDGHKIAYIAQVQLW